MIDVQTELTRDTVRATTTVGAGAAEVFDYLRRPANHATISGDHSVKQTIKGPDVLSAGDRFAMSMHIGLPYRISSRVVEFEPDRLLAWCHMGGHRWRWQVEPAGDGRSTVTETFDVSTAKAPFLLRLAGFPRRHEANVSASVANLASHFSRS
jgi:uncharacterized protein YndB with AHSA1/START domain